MSSWRKHVHTILMEDVGRTTIRREDCECCGAKRNFSVDSLMGRVQIGDIGKRIYRVDGILQVENDEQRDARLAKETRV